VKALRRGRIPLKESVISRGPPVSVSLDDRPLIAYSGETVAAAIVADEGLTTRETVRGSRRGIYCGMGICYDCLVVINGVPNTRACMTIVTEGMRIYRQVGHDPELRLRSR
jgi:hypothetical protein